MENTLITGDRLNSLVELCKKTNAKVIAEVGVYKGGSMKYLAQNFPNGVVIGFDTFKGLPESKWNESEIHKPGEFSETSKEDVYQFLLKDVANVSLHEGLFPDSAKGYEVSNTKFDFVHIDTDFYQSVKDCLEWFWPRMNEGGIIALDDFQWSNCPGVEQALEEFGQPFFRSVDYQAYIIKN